MAAFAPFIAPAVGAAASAGLGALFGRRDRRQQQRNNPSDAAMPYLNQIPGAGREYLAPFLNQGQYDTTAPRAYEEVLNEYNREPDLYSNPSGGLENYGSMASDPQAFLDRIMRGYTPSEGYQYKQRKLLDAAHSTAAAGGLVGTQGDVENRSNLVKNLLGEDMQQFLANIFGIQQAGLGGQERLLRGRYEGQNRRLGGRERAWTQIGHLGEGRVGRGYDAAAELARMMSGNLSERGQLAYAGAEQRNSDRESRRNNLLNLITSGAGLGLNYARNSGNSSGGGGSQWNNYF